MSKAIGGAHPPSGGEEDYCESSDLSGCATYLHYGSSNSQIAHDMTIALSQWHTFRFERLNHVVTAYVDNMSTPVWRYTGSSTTLPDTIKRVRPPAGMRLLVSGGHDWQGGHPDRLDHDRRSSTKLTRALLGP